MSKKLEHVALSVNEYLSKDKTFETKRDLQF